MSENSLKLRKKNLILIYIFIYPICDMLFTLVENAGISLPISPNQIIRGLGLIAFMLIIKNIKNWTKIMLITVWSICCFFIQIELYYSTSAITDFSFCLKFIQNFVFLFAFIQLFKDGIIEFDEAIKYLVWASYIAIFSIILSYFGIGAASYAGSSRFGVKGLFSIQSTITAYLLLIMPLYYIRFKKNFSVQMIICIIALFSIGSKTGVFGTLLEVILLSVYDIRNYSKDKNKKLKYIVFVGIAICILPFALRKYISYLSNLYHSNSYYYNLSAFLLSNRNDQIIAAQNGVQLIGNHLKQKIGMICGYGYTSMSGIMSTNYKYDAIERDFQGVYYYFGIVSLLILVYYLVKIIFRLAKMNVRYRFNERYLYVSLIIVGVGIVYGWLGGHIFYEAMNQLPFWIVSAFVLCYKIPKKREKGEI